MKDVGLEEVMREKEADGVAVVKQLYHPLFMRVVAMIATGEKQGACWCSVDQSNCCHDCDGRSMTAKLDSRLLRLCNGKTVLHHDLAARDRATGRL